MHTHIHTQKFNLVGLKKIRTLTFIPAKCIHTQSKSRRNAAHTHTRTCTHTCTHTRTHTFPNALGIFLHVAKIHLMRTHAYTHTHTH